MIRYRYENREGACALLDDAALRRLGSSVALVPEGGKGPVRLVRITDPKGRAEAWLATGHPVDGGVELCRMSVDDAPSGVTPCRVFAVHVPKDRILLGLSNPSVYERIYNKHFKAVTLLYLYHAAGDACWREVWLLAGKRSVWLEGAEITPDAIPGCCEELAGEPLEERISSLYLHV